MAHNKLGLLPRTEILLIHKNKFQTRQFRQSEFKITYFLPRCIVLTHYNIGNVKVWPFLLNVPLIKSGLKDLMFRVVTGFHYHK